MGTPPLPDGRGSANLNSRCSQRLQNRVRRTRFSRLVVQSAPRSRLPGGEIDDGPRGGRATLERQRRGLDEAARAGFDVYRDHLNTPAFFALLPEVAGLTGLDIGCGEGHNTRLLARRGARVKGIDIAEFFVAHARQAEADEPLGIEYRVGSAVALPFADQAFDFATGFMSFMDMPETDRVLAEAFRVTQAGRLPAVLDLPSLLRHPAPA